MTTGLRFDQGTIREFARTPQGGLRVRAALAKTGTLRYRDTDGREWTEYRPPAATFAADALASLRGAPVTDGHPPGLVTTENYRAHARGHVADDVAPEGAYLVATLVVNDADLVRAIEAGERSDISIGYVAALDKTPGVTPEGARYDAVQTAIVGNHAAVLPPGAGRAGPDVCLRLDGAAEEVTAAPAATGDRIMRKLKIGGREYRADDDGEIAAAQEAVDAQQSGLDKATSECTATKSALTDAMTRVASLEAALAQAKAEADAAAAAPDADDAVDEEVLDAHLALRERARKVLGPDFAFKGLKTTDVKRAVIGKVFSTVKLDAKAAVETVDALFEAATLAPAPGGAGPAARNDALGQTHAAVVGAGAARADAAADDPETRMRRRTAERWKQPTSVTTGKAGA